MSMKKAMCDNKLMALNQENEDGLLSAKVVVDIEGHGESVHGTPIIRQD